MTAAANLQYDTLDVQHRLVGDLLRRVMEAGDPIPAFVANLEEETLNLAACLMTAFRRIVRGCPRGGKHGNDEAVWYFRFARGKGEIARRLPPRGVAAAVAATPAP